LPDIASSEGVDDINEYVTSCLERGLDHYGPTTKQVVFWELDKNFKVKENKILMQPEKFVKCLRQMFGPGSKTIEKVIIEEIKSSPQYSNVCDSDLILALKQMRAQYQRLQVD
jgi:hypothetical protein